MDGGGGGCWILCPPRSIAGFCWRREEGGGDVRGEDGVLRLPPSTEFAFVIVGQRMAAWGHVRLLRV
jgi:hypothetical protein